MAGEYPLALEELIAALARLPGIGRRTAERLAMALVEWDPADLAELGGQLAELPQRLRQCAQCGNLSDEELCRICRDPQRDAGLLCIVEHSRQVPVIEKCGHFRGLYHVLGGRLSPLEGVGPEQLHLAALYARLATQPPREVILATSPDVEGEATAAYLAQELRERGAAQVSRIALGIPVGADLSFADSATMALAIDTRRPAH
jgi:recombination protein RecR